MNKLQKYVEGILTIPHDNRFSAFALALFIFFLAFIFRIVLSFAVPEGLPYVTFFPAVLLAAIVCGPIPAFIVVHLSALAGTLWHSEVGHLYRATDVAFFYVTGALIVFLFAIFRRTYLELREKDRRLEIVNQELSHRIRNLFLIANSLVVQTIRSGSPPHEMIDAITGRFHALATSQTLFSPTPESRIFLSDLVNSVPGSLAPSAMRFYAGGPQIALSSNIATTLALVLNELATNAIKYGSWSNADGIVQLSWRTEAGHTVLEWQETGGPSPRETQRQGAGSDLIKHAIRGAAVNYRLAQKGATCIIHLPPDGGQPDSTLSHAA